MALILSIDTATEFCSVSLSFKGNELLTLVNETRFSHAETITLTIAELFKVTGYGICDLNAVAISEGPGSYTGLRIGTSVAKGICYANQIPLINISTLQGMAYACKKKFPNLSYMPLIDARRNEVYTALYDKELNEKIPVNTLIIESEKDILQFTKGEPAILFGNGLLKIKNYINNTIITFSEKTNFNAVHLNELAYSKLFNKDLADLAYFEPVYLKLFEKKL